MKSTVFINRLMTALMLFSFQIGGCSTAPNSTQPPQNTSTQPPTETLSPTIELPTATSLPLSETPTQTEEPLATLPPAWFTATPEGVLKTPKATSMTLSNNPELILADNRPSRKTDVPEHVVYSLPGMDQVLLASELSFYGNLLVDIYYPPGYQFDAQLPVVIVTNGGADKGGHEVSDKDQQHHIDWGKLLAVSGMIAVSAQAGPEPYTTLTQLLDYLNANADQLGIDMTRVGFWGGSAHVVPANLAISLSPYRDNFRAAVFLYPYLISMPETWPSHLSLMVVRAGADDIVSPSLVDRYVESARSGGISVEYIVVEDAVHGFDIYQDTQASKDAVQQALEFFKDKLLTK